MPPPEFSAAELPAGESTRVGVEPRSCRLGFLISEGAGTVLAVQDAIDRGELPGCSIALIVCNVTGAPGVEAARKAGLRALTLEGRGHQQREYEEALDLLLRKMGVDLVCQTGYLRVLSREFIRRWPYRLLSVHGSLLPAFPGARPERQALECGVQITGCTVSFVEDSAEALSGGPIIVQRAVRVADGDTEETLRARLLPEEHDGYIEAIRRVVSGQYSLQGRRYLFRAGHAARPVSGVLSDLPEPGSRTARIRAAGLVQGS